MDWELLSNAVIISAIRSEIEINYDGQHLKRKQQKQNLAGAQSWKLPSRKPKLQQIGVGGAI